MVNTDACLESATKRIIHRDSLGGAAKLRSHVQSAIIHCLVTIR